MARMPRKAITRQSMYSRSQGEYPVKVLRLGNAYRVVTADLLKLLGLERQPLRAVQVEGEGKQHGLCA